MSYSRLVRAKVCAKLAAHFGGPAMVHVVERKRKRSKLVEERTPPTSDAEADASWVILESGVLAVQTSLNVIGIDGAQRPIFYDHHQKRLVCKHGWPANRVFFST